MKRLLSQLTCSSLASVMLLANAGQAMAQQATSQATSAGPLPAFLDNRVSPASGVALVSRQPYEV